MASVEVSQENAGPEKGEGASGSVTFSAEERVEFTTVNLDDDAGGDQGKPAESPKASVARAEAPHQPTPTANAQLDFNLDESRSNNLALAESFTTTQADGAVRLRMSSAGGASMAPISLPCAFKDTVAKIPQLMAMAVKRDGQWVRWTYKQYYNDVVRMAKALIRAGLEPHRGVGILGFNSPEWFIAFMGSIYAGGIATGVYTTNSADACQHVLEDSQSQIVIVENDMQLQKILRIREQLPALKTVVQYSGKLKEKYANVYTWDEFLALGAQVPDAAVQGRLSGIAPNHCCSLIYTSGTTGSPKGVMISHDNYTFLARTIAADVKMDFGREIVISYLPLSHSAAQFYDLVGGFIHGTSIFFAGPDALKGGLLQTLKEIRPTIFGGVPRVWEKMMEGLVAIGKENKGLKKTISTWVKDVGLKGSYAKINKTSMPKFWGLANSVGFKKVRLGLGLDRCKLLVSGAAPISKQVVEYFLSLDLILYEQYGMSETSGPSVVSIPEAIRLTSVGKPITGTQVRIDNPDSDNSGEIQMYGRHLMMGYLNREQQTADTMTADGWIHSGDLGKVDNDNFLFITGRAKELLITAGGENIPPVIIEDNVKAELPFISNCILIGDKRKFLTMLLTLKVVVNLDTMEPKDDLAPAAVDWCREHGSAATTVNHVISHRDEIVLRAIQAGIDKVNKAATSNAQRIQKWSIVPRDFSLPGGELGPTLKLKRPVVLDKYKKTITSFYGEE